MTRMLLRIFSIMLMTIPPAFVLYMALRGQNSTTKDLHALLTMIIASAAIVTCLVAVFMLGLKIWEETTKK